MKILYVEDNPANVFLVKRVARMGKHEIVNYIDGNQALQKFDDVNPDLVLMDIQLAGDKSGLDVVKELRARGVETAIIAVTAYAMVGDKERCIEAGCTDYLAKPLPIPRLVEIFKHYSDKAIAKAENKTDATKTEKTPVSASVPAENIKPVIDTQETVSETTAEAKDNASEILSEATDSATITAIKAENAVNDTIAKAKETVDEVKEAVSDTIADTSEKVTEAITNTTDETDKASTESDEKGVTASNEISKSTEILSESTNTDETIEAKEEASTGETL